ncbi:ATP-binding cassette domain-containing protein [Flavobacteriales bacterium]|jgi:ABC-2 type transport system ATP-binding protein|nr:ATP-binding cassette domain-containing protein [Flavobacteriales bacterium]|tara:strand:+ start:7964 stop:8665 length:702 start_codon:yes stop_codon:yes gene_type:complete
MSLEVININKSYGEVKALKNISFKLKKGEIVGFLGPNGAGKSTLMKIITSFINQDSGKVIISSIDKDVDAILTKSKIGYLSENNPLYNEMTVLEYLNFVSQIYNLKDSKKRILKVSKEIGLVKVMEQEINSLSKGFRQRVGIAATLVHDPEILLLDEPTTGLDPNQLVEIRHLIKKIGQEKIILLSTHIMQEIPKICNRVIVINNGKLVDDKSLHSKEEKEIDFDEYFYNLTK